MKTAINKFQNSSYMNGKPMTQIFTLTTRVSKGYSVPLLKISKP